MLILHLCADIGSDSYPYELDSNYEVLKIGQDVGVENVRYEGGVLRFRNQGLFPRYSDMEVVVHGIIANPVCTEFSCLKSLLQDEEEGMVLVEHCQRLIRECSPEWWVIENPATGTLRNYLGVPEFVYQPWEFGSPWTKKTALWGKFSTPEVLFSDWGDVPKNRELYKRPGREKPSLAFLHVAAVHDIPEFSPFIDVVRSDNALRSLCSQGFAKEFKRCNP